MSNMLLSIIIPTYKRNDFLCRAIDSILINYGSYEIIVVDDNDENSIYRKYNIETMKKYQSNDKVKYLKHKQNKNGAAARNTGIKYAKGEYITFLDDDDEFTSNRIEEVEKVIKNEKPDFIFTGTIFKKNGKVLNYNEKLNKEEINKKNLIKLLLMEKSFIGTGSNMICKSNIVKKINGFDESFTRNQDLEYLIRYLELSKSIVYIDKNLVIKNLDDVSNFPSYEKMLIVKEKFLNKFQYIINKYDEKEKKEIYVKNYRVLLRCAYNDNDISKPKIAREYIKEKGFNLYIYEIKLYIKKKLKKLLKKT